MSESTGLREVGGLFARAAASVRNLLSPRPSGTPTGSASLPPLVARTRAGFHGAEVTRLNLDWRTSNASADDDIRSSIMLLRSRARDLQRNNPYIQRFLDIRAANLLGPEGIGHQAVVRLRASGPDGKAGDLNERVNDYLEEKWRSFINGPVTTDGRMNLNTFLRLQLDTEAVDGESFTRVVLGRDFRHGLALQPIDPDLVAETANSRASRDGLEVRLGVEMDGFGRRVAYHVYDWARYVPGSRQVGLERIAAREILHQYRVRRANQTRGITRLACVMTDLQDVAGYDEAVIIGARAGANQVAFAQWKDNATPTIANLENRKPMQIELNPGTYTELEPGLEVVAFDPSQPTNVYSEFTKTVLRRIASGLGVAHASLSNDLRDVNYSSTKVGLQLEREIARMDQRDAIDMILQPLYLRWLEAATLSGELELPGPDWREFAAVQWVPRGFEWIDPLKEVQAVEAELRLGLTSRQRVLAERGVDFFKLVEELAQEDETAEEAGIEIAAKAPSSPLPASQDDEDPADAAAAAKQAAEDTQAEQADSPRNSRGARARGALRRVA